MSEALQAERVRLRVGLSPAPASRARVVEGVTDRYDLGHKNAVAKITGHKLLRYRVASGHGSSVFAEM